MEEPKYEMISLEEMWDKLRRLRPAVEKAIGIIQQLEEGKVLVIPLSEGLTEKEMQKELDHLRTALYDAQLHRWDEKGHVHIRFNKEKNCAYVYCSGEPIRKEKE